MPPNQRLAWMPQENYFENIGLPEKLWRSSAWGLWWGQLIWVRICLVLFRNKFYLNRQSSHLQKSRYYDRPRSTQGGIQSPEKSRIHVFKIKIKYKYADDLIKSFHKTHQSSDHLKAIKEFVAIKVNVVSEQTMKIVKI